MLRRLWVGDMGQIKQRMRQGSLPFQSFVALLGFLLCALSLTGLTTVLCVLRFVLSGLR
ncbi:uncharacterized protein LACBIDRAFT_308984 [Laccaria bicolor S238N-H82]|uniref:Predicted protein n=1 Tax=Laccaria bicolor (strain S238N-H82 / ATCC MYA-4686) TaxID=486041 RepID=B0CV90_LACBS|nr:uncharacterized protein LACBIDRAFT_308984 [Laccaria bicolor S238N-H82]EDR13290.1 predicted protein [Laccaria bicolor S238N-H82]|eukprot:XP_001875788.1 predicted protein [Laccaria bicolor S238N-H82]